MEFEMGEWVRVIDTEQTGILEMFDGERYLVENKQENYSEWHYLEEIELLD